MSHPAPATAPRFSESLHGLRGLAALVVVLGHVVLQIQAHGGSLPVLPALFNGSACVVLFFVLSGYVLRPSALEAAAGGRAFAGYAVRRLFRLMPLMVATNCVFAALGVTVLRDLPYPDPLSGGIDLPRFLAGFVGGTPRINGPSWSIFVEILFSLAMPAVALLAATQPAGRGLAVALAVALLPLPLPYHAQIYGPAFLLGALVPRAAPLFRHLDARHAGGTALCVLGAALAFWAVRPLAGLVLSAEALNASPWIVLAEAALCTPAIALLAACPGRGGALRRPLAQRGGDLSYAVYLLHFNVVVLVHNGLRAAGLTDGFALFGLGAAATLAITVPLARLCETAIEAPGIALGRRLAGRLARGAAARSA